MPLKLLTAPASEPVTLQETKDYLRITDTDDDALISNLITGVRLAGESFTSRVWVTQSWALWLDRCWILGTRRVYEIPRPPLQSVTLVNTRSTSNVISVFDPANYFVDNVSEPGRLVLNTGKTWPADLAEINALEIRFTAGYGDPADVPETLRVGCLEWVKLLMANKAKFFEEGEAAAGILEMNKGAVPEHVAQLWNPYKVFTL